MSEEECESVSSKFESISRKLNLMNKVVQSILEKLEVKNSFVNEGEEKKRGKPKGSTFEEKQTSYLDMLNTKKIKEPKPDTILYYKFQYDKDKDLYYVS